jgi:hypothetical protein
VADRLTMAMPYHPDFTNGVVIQAYSAMDYVNKWPIFNTDQINTGLGPGPNQDTVSLGGFTVAPDGTNTMQKIVESASGPSLHGLTSGWNSQMFTGVYKLRNAVIVKAAERTRICLGFNCATFQSLGIGTGVKAVFDLAGGQVGVAPFAFGNLSTDSEKTWNTSAANSVATIAPLDGGVYICMLDTPMGIQQGAPGGFMFSTFYLDSGSGTAAESTNYTGDGASGVYAWKSCLLPPAAFRLGNRTFFDDFTDPTMSNIDLTDSRAPGFDWYIHAVWPCDGFNLATPTPAGCFSQTGSLLKITNQPTDAIGMMGACNKGTDPGNIGGVVWQRPSPGPNVANAYTGTRVFHPPMLVESRHAWNFNTNATDRNHVSWWTTSIERLYNPAAYTPGGQNFSVENDWAEFQPIGLGTLPSHSNFDAGTTTGLNEYIQQVLGGYAIWYSDYAYGTNAIVAYLGVLYQAQQNSTNQVPLSNPTFWLAFTPPGSSVVPLTPPVCDPTQLNTYGVLWVPSSDDDLGQMINFFNGVCTGTLTGFSNLFCHIAWGWNAGLNDNIPPGFAPAKGITGLTAGDSQTYAIQYDGGPTATYSIDWVSVTQD